MLGERLTRRGVSLTVAALAAALLPDGASAGVSSMVMTTTIRAALLVAAGETAVVATPAAILMKGVLRTMFLQKLKIALIAVMTTVALGAGGFVYQSGTGASRAQAQAAPARPPNELEALRKENELLKLNLQVVLEKVRAQEEQLRALKDKTTARAATALGDLVTVREARLASDAEDRLARQKAADALENAAKRLREQLNEPAAPQKK